MVGVGRRAGGAAVDQEVDAAERIGHGGIDRRHTLVADRCHRMAGSGGAARGERRRLRLAAVPGLLHDRRDLRVGHEARPALVVPVEERPDAVLLGRIAEHQRALAPVLLALVGALGPEDLQEAIEVLDLCRGEQHVISYGLVLVRVIGSAGDGRRLDEALLRVDRPELLDDLEPAVARPRDVHVHAQVVLAGHDGRRPAGARVDLGVVQRRDHVLLTQGARLGRRRGPEPQAAVQARASAAAGEPRVARIQRVVLLEQLDAERVGDGLVVVQAAVEPLDVLGRHHVEEVLVEVRADQMPAAGPEPGVVQLLQKRRHAGRHDGVEHRVGAAGDDALHRLAVVHVVEREVLLPHDRAAVGRDHLADALVHHVRPDVVGGRQIELPRAGLAHHPRDEGVDLLRRHRAGAEDERIGLLPLVLLGIDVQRPALHDRRSLDGLPRRAVDATEDDVDVVFLDELRRTGGSDVVVGRAVLEVQLHLPAQEPAPGVDVADDHPRDVGVRDADERQRSGLICDEAHLDGVAGHGSSLRGGRPAVRRTAAAAPWFLAGCSRRSGPHSSGDHPILAPQLRLAEFVATLALAQDNAFGQPLESQLRSCLLASWICEAAGFEQEVCDDAYWVALLRYVGCTGHAHEVATVFGDEIAIRAQTLVHDAANPTEVMGDVVTFATVGRSDDEREEIIRMLQETAHEWAVYNSTSGCEVADVLVARLDFASGVREALACTFERWNGKGFPAHVEGEAIPLAMRVVHLSHDMEAIGRLFSVDRALEAAEDRRGRTYDPALADLFVGNGRAWFERLGAVDPWAAGLALEPQPHRVLDAEGLAGALAVAADFIDMKSPHMGGHSRRCAQLATDAARVLGQPEDVIAALGRAALVHDFGATGVSNSIWDKPGALTRAEFDRVELHTMLTEQMLRRSPALAALNTVASRHHEKCDGSGYHTRTRADTGDLAACLLTATEIYVGMTTERADRPRFSDDDAAAELRRLEADGLLEPRAARAVLVAAGHGEPTARTRKRPQNPGGLSRREVDVLQLAARGLTTREIGDRLIISPKTADRHIQNIYNKISVSTRAAAALWAMQHELVG